MNEIPPWLCHVLGEEARRLKLCASDPVSEGRSTDCNKYRYYNSLSRNNIGWEQSLDLDSMQAEKVQPEEALMQLRSEVRFGRYTCPSLVSLLKIFSGQI